MAFQDVRINVDVERGAAGGPEFRTTVTSLVSGKEYRNQEWTFARHKWNLSYGIMTQVLYSEVREFFFGRRGRLHSWRFKDWSDYSAEDEILGTGDASEDQFQVIKTYEVGGPSAYIRRITRLVSGTLIVKLDGTPTVAYTISSTGLITFTAPPGIGVEITADYEFDIPVRFDIDFMPIALEWVNAGSIPDINVIEILEGDE